MAASVALQSLTAGTLFTTGAFPNIASFGAGRNVYVFEQGTVANQPQVNWNSFQVQVYADPGLTVKLAQPLLTGSAGAVPGWIAAGQSIEIYDTVALLAYPGEALKAVNFNSAASVLLTPSGGDDSTNLQTAITALNGYGTVLLAPGTFSFNNASSVYAAALPRNATGIAIVGSGVGVTTITLSANTYQFLYMPYVADYDVYRNIWLSDLTVNAASIPTNLASSASIVIGNQNFALTNTTQRANISNVQVRRVTVTGIPTSSTGVYNGIVFESRHLTAAESTQTSLKSIIIEDFSCSGADAGWVIAGTVATGNTCNVFFDDLHLNRLTHNTGITPTSSTTGTGNQIGSTAFGGSVYVNEVNITGSGDVGFEFDGFQYLEVNNSTSTDAKNDNWIVRNFNTPANVDAQRAVFTNCRAVVANVDGDTVASFGFAVGSSASPLVSFGTVVLRDCSYQVTAAHPTQTSAIYNNGGPLNRLIVDDFEIIYDSVNSAGSHNVNSIVLQPTTSCVVSLKNLRQSYSGTLSGGGFVVGMVLGANASSTIMTLDIDGWEFNSSLASVGNGFTRMAQIGNATQGTLRGKIQRIKVTGFSGGDTTPTGLWIADASNNANNAISPVLTLEDLDFSQLPSGATWLSPQGTSANFIENSMNGPGFRRNPVTGTTYQATAFDDIIACTGTASNAITVTLASASQVGAGASVIITDEAGSAATHNVTISPTIDGATQKITTNHGQLQFYSDGSNWHTL